MPVLVVVLLLGTVAGCSGDADPAPGGDRSPGSPASSTRTTPDLPPAPTVATLGAVTGRLDGDRRAAARRGVRNAVDRWTRAAFVRGYRDGRHPRHALRRAFPGFTAGAAAQARGDKALMSNAALGPRLAWVHVRQRTVVVDLLAREGRPVAATARFLLAQRVRGEAADGVDRVERVRGSLYLVRAKRGWRTFGYDVRRGRLP